MHHSFSYVVVLALLAKSIYVVADHEGDDHSEVSSSYPHTSSEQNAETARWLTSQVGWGTLASSATNLFHSSEHGQGSSPLHAGILPFASSPESGRLFFYLMGENHAPGVSLTLSQASLDPALFYMAACGSLESAVDAEDPRCAKMTFTGNLHPCGDDTECVSIGKDALFNKHPTMKHWPKNHHFAVHELDVQAIWMIANFGGGSTITPKEYAAADVGRSHEIEGGKAVDPPTFPGDDHDMPHWYQKAKRARWIVHNALWSTVTTTSSRPRENAESTDTAGSFGNVRSITDGADWKVSTGKPVFYLPDVDPTARDIAEDNYIVLTTSEASLAERVNKDGQVCGGHDAGSPVCAQVALYGKAVPTKKLRSALQWFKASHPLAPWLAKGGSHMQGTYYTIELEKVVILDFYGGPTEVDVDEYLRQCSLRACTKVSM